MSEFVVNKQHLRDVLIFCFNWKKTAAEAQRLLAEVYGESAPTKESCIGLHHSIHFISKMSNFIPEKRHLREVLLHYFFLKKKAAVSHRLLQEAYGEHAPSISTCEYWFRRFKSGNFDVEDKERPGQPKRFEDEELKALIDEDCCQTQEELAKSLGVSQPAISLRLKAE